MFLELMIPSMVMMNTTWETLGNFKMFHRYPENLVIKDGEVFYIYRPFESPQKKFLYSEDIYLKAIAIR